MTDIHQHLDIGSRIVIVLTAILFIVALFVKGLGHDLLLEIGVFLVSLKLIMMAYKNSVAAKDLDQRLAHMQDALTRIENASSSKFAA